MESMIRSENPEPYGDATLLPGLSTSERNLVDRALRVLEQCCFARERDALTSPGETGTYLQLRLGQLPYEVFAVLFLDNRHRLIAVEEMFRGTVDGASVHPREVLRMALHHNAAAVILAHNHPSGITEPSRADEQITQRLVEALTLIDVRVLDHFVVGDGYTSFAERGLM